MKCLLLVLQIAALNVKVTESVSYDWAAQWYIGEPYQMICNATNETIDFNVTWDTPTQKGLQWPLINDENYQIMNKDGTNLLIKAISPELHGVYMCNVHDKKSGKVIERHIHGLNIHEEKYRDIFDKYKHNFKVAGIAAGSFLGLIILVSIVWSFRYQPNVKDRDNPKRNLAHAPQSYTNESGSQEMSVYENAGFDSSTKM
ncbi:hypothetical protein ACF0H5_022475 [Mactra antiquata]